MSALHSASETDYGEAERLLRAVVADGFMLHCCGPKAAPFALVASDQWKGYIDVVTIRRLTDTTTRVYAPQRRRIDVNIQPRR